MATKPVILCVDDDKHVLDTMAQQLNERFGKGYEIEKAESAEEALEVLVDLEETGQQCPVVISDQVMRSMKGDEFLVMVHRLYPSIQKVLVTGQAATQALIRTVNEAALFRFLSKPWEQIELVHTVERALQHADASRLSNRRAENLMALNELTAALQGQVPHPHVLLEMLRVMGKLTGATEAAYLPPQHGAPSLDLEHNPNRGWLLAEKEIRPTVEPCPTLELTQEAPLPFAQAPTQLLLQLGPADLAGSLYLRRDGKPLHLAAEDVPTLRSLQAIARLAVNKQRAPRSAPHHKMKDENQVPTAFPV